MNVYQGFFDEHGDNTIRLGLTSSGASLSGSTVPANQVPDGSFGPGAVAHSLQGAERTGYTSTIGSLQLNQRFNALARPLKVNKLHDYFTTVLPSPQKAQSSVFAPATGQISSVPVITGDVNNASSVSLRFLNPDGASFANSQLFASSQGGDIDVAFRTSSSTPSGVSRDVIPANLQTAEGATVTGLGISVDDLRMAAAIQQVYEISARGGSRYREIVQSFFGITADDPYSDIPKCLGHITRDLDLYQTAQTSASETGNTPQGNLAAFGYTATSGHLFENTFLEHGYVHIFAVVRHRNVYTSFLPRDNFRLNMLDFYLPPLANISEQPVYAREINPFAPNPNDPFGYQEAWAEYRYEPDQVSGLMRTFPTGSESLSVWNYADDFDSSLQISNANWLLSNSEEVLNRTLAVTSSVSPQFKGEFRFHVDKDLPMPTYSVPGLDII